MCRRSTGRKMTCLSTCASRCVRALSTTRLLDHHEPGPCRPPSSVPSPVTPPLRNPRVSRGRADQDLPCFGEPQLVRLPASRRTPPSLSEFARTDAPQNGRRVHLRSTSVRSLRPPPACKLAQSRYSGTRRPPRPRRRQLLPVGFLRIDSFGLQIARVIAQRRRLLRFHEPSGAGTVTLERIASRIAVGNPPASPLSHRSGRHFLPQDSAVSSPRPASRIVVKGVSLFSFSAASVIS